MMKYSFSRTVKIDKGKLNPTSSGIPDRLSILIEFANG
jgi:hypothetical protein